VFHRAARPVIRSGQGILPECLREIEQRCRKVDDAMAGNLEHEPRVLLVREGMDHLFPSSDLRQHLVIDGAAAHFDELNG